MERPEPTPGLTSISLLLLQHFPGILFPGNYFSEFEDHSTHWFSPQIQGHEGGKWRGQGEKRGLALPEPTPPRTHSDSPLRRGDLGSPASLPEYDFPDIEAHTTHSILQRIQGHQGGMEGGSGMKRGSAGPELMPPRTHSDTLLRHGDLWSATSLPEFDFPEFEAHSTHSLSPRIVYVLLLQRRRRVDSSSGGGSVDDPSD